MFPVPRYPGVGKSYICYTCFDLRWQEIRSYALVAEDACADVSTARKIIADGELTNDK